MALRIGQPFGTVRSVMAFGATHIPQRVDEYGRIYARDIDRSREMVIEGVARLLPHAEQAGIKLGIEPLHPMFAADRSVIVSLNQANGIIELFKSRNLGVVI